MKKLILTLTSILFVLGSSVYCQDPIQLTVQQSPPLQATAGDDTEISKGDFISLGDDPAALDGYGNYIYLWSPATGLDDPTLANPIATPETTTTYLLTVTDANNCSATDEITITVDASGTDIVPIDIDVRCYPNPVDNELIIEMVGQPGEVSFRLINPLGKELASMVKKMTGHEAFDKIPMKDYPPGIFYLQITTANTTTYQTILKTR